MNRIYEAPELTVTTVNAKDIITASPGDTEVMDIDLW